MKKKEKVAEVSMSMFITATAHWDIPIYILVKKLLTSFHYTILVNDLERGQSLYNTCK